MEYATVRDEQRCERAVRRAWEACLTACACAALRPSLLTLNFQALLQLLTLARQRSCSFDTSFHNHQRLFSRLKRHSPLHRPQHRVVRYGSVSPHLDFIQYGANENSLNAAEQRELNSRMEKKQMKEFMTVCFTWNPIKALS
jgi:hypothetical protein